MKLWGKLISYVWLVMGFINFTVAGINFQLENYEWVFFNVGSAVLCIIMFGRLITTAGYLSVIANRKRDKKNHTNNS